MRLVEVPLNRLARRDEGTLLTRTLKLHWHTV